MIPPAPGWIQDLLVILAWLVIWGVCAYGTISLLSSIMIKKYRGRRR